MSESFRTQRRVEFADTDLAGIAHFSAFFRWMEAAEHELLRSIGLRVHAEEDGQHVSFPRVSARCDYQSPARFEEVLDIEVAVQRLGTKSVTFTARFSRDGAPLASGEMTSVCCRIFPDKLPESIPLPADIRDALLPFVAK